MKSDLYIKILVGLFATGLMICFLGGVTGSVGLLYFGGTVCSLAWVMALAVFVLIWKDVEKIRADTAAMCERLDKLITIQQQALNARPIQAPPQRPAAVPAPESRRVYEITT